MLINRKREYVNLIFKFHHFSNSKFDETTGLSSSEIISVEIIVSKFGFFLKLTWSMDGGSSLRPMDEKCRSATASVVRVALHILCEQFFYLREQLTNLEVLG